MLTGRPFNPRTSIVHAIANIICAVVFGHRFSSEDESFSKLIKAVYFVIYFQATIWGRVRTYTFNQNFPSSNLCIASPTPSVYGNRNDSCSAFAVIRKWELGSPLKNAHISSYSFTTTDV